MNRYLLFTFMVMFGFSVAAQDVIFKTNGFKINAKVIEVTGQQIAYKDFNVQSGQTYTIDISEVAVIRYENGQMMVFDDAIIYEEPDKMSSGTLKSEFDRIGDNDDQMLKFFRENNFSKYYNSFESACRQRNAGRALLGTGIGLSIGGLVVTIIGAAQYDGSYDTIEEDRFIAFMVTGYALMITGEVLTIVSIPISITAGVRKRIIKNNFAEEYFGIRGYTYQPKLNFGQTTHGIGLTLNF